jgi:hypothetical protein
MDPTSDFLKNRGYDLYKSKANERQQTGIKDLLSLIGTYSGNVAPTPGQEMQNQQQTAALGEQTASRVQQGDQFQQNYGFEQQQWQKQLELLKQLVNPAGGSGGYGNVFGRGQPGNAMDYSMYTNVFQPPPGVGAVNDPNNNFYSSGQFTPRNNRNTSMGYG